jgi:hypothetical protein
MCYYDYDITTNAWRVKSDGENNSLSICIFISFRAYAYTAFPSLLFGHPIAIAVRMV